VSNQEQKDAIKRIDGSQVDGDAAKLWAGRLGDEATFDSARAALLDLGRLGLDAALDAYIKPTTRLMHENAGQVLCAFGAMAVPSILNYLRQPGDVFTISTASLLGTIADARAVDDLIILARHKSHFTRASAVDALRRIGDKRAVEAVIDRLHDRAPAVAYEAARCLGEIGDDRAVPELERLLKRPSTIRQPGTMHEAQDAIEKIMRRTSVRANR